MSASLYLTAMYAVLCLLFRRLPVLPQPSQAVKVSVGILPIVLQLVEGAVCLGLAMEGKQAVRQLQAR